MEAIYWDHYYNEIIFLNLMIAIGLFATLRLFSGTIAHINATDELIKRNNPAFGISLAATTFAITIMLSGTVYGAPHLDAHYSIVAVGVYGLLGITLMAVTRLIFDKFVLPGILLREEILKGNIAIGIVDAANVLAIAIILRTIISWVIGFDIGSLLAIIGGYLVSQLVLSTMTIIKNKVFGIVNNGYDAQEELKNGNIAFALRFAGLKIGAALAMAAAAHIVVYEHYDIPTILKAWFLASAVFIVAWRILSFCAERIILLRVNIKQEILEEKNVALGAFVAVIYISMGILISSV